MQNDPLSRLHANHLPDAISFWPPAIGWWVLFFLVLGLIGGLVWLMRRHRNQAFKRQALKELLSYQRQFETNNDLFIMTAGVSELLRRVVLKKFSHTNSAGLTGTDWLKFLDETGHTRDFSEGPGRILSTLPFMNPYGEDPIETVDTTALIQSVQQWIKQQ